jgi:hypothetical protein
VFWSDAWGAGRGPAGDPQLTQTRPRSPVWVRLWWR